MGGKVYTPLGAQYHETKHALEEFSDCLSIEVKEFGIDVIIIEPGGIKTKWKDITIEAMLENAGSTVYFQTTHATAKMFKESYENPREFNPNLIANTILKAITVKNPKTRYIAGYMARPYLFLKKILSNKLFDFILLTSLRKEIK